jgi:hypothetical protein
VRLPWLAQVHVDVDQPRGNDAAACTERTVRLAAQLAGRRDCYHASFAKQHVHLLIDAAGEIDYTPVLDKERFHSLSQAKACSYQVNDTGTLA